MPDFSWVTLLDIGAIISVIVLLVKIGNGFGKQSEKIEDLEEKSNKQQAQIGNLSSEIMYMKDEMGTLKYNTGVRLAEIDTKIAGLEVSLTEIKAMDKDIQRELKNISVTLAKQQEA